MPPYLPYLLSPLICALIGWLTNYIAIKMLFRPREPVKILFWQIQGIFPKRRKALAENLGDMIEKQLFNHDDIQKVVHNPEFVAIFHQEIDKHISSFVDKKIETLHPMLKMFLNDEMRGKIKGMLREEMDSLLPDLLRKVTEELESRLVVRHLIRDKVEAFSMDRIEDILFSIMKKEFRFIEIVGGVLGFLIGLAQAVMFYLTSAPAG